jgi:putative N6-adenine-specific DNA methylase
MQSTALIKRIKRHVIGPDHEFFIATSPSLNQVCLEELRSFSLSIQDVKPVPGGVSFKGRLSDCFFANLNLRTANRILMRVDEFKATNFKALEEKVARIPWELFLPENSSLRIIVSTSKSRLYHKDAVIQRILSGISTRIPVSAESSSEQLVFVRGVDDRFTFSLDSSGDLLYKRGVKQHGGRAPLRETLVAAALRLAGYTPDKPLVDPMCGSGTFSLEAAMMAKNIPPGWFRDFAFMGWPGFKKEAWDHLKKKQREGLKALEDPLIFASDQDETACNHLEQTLSEKNLTDAVCVNRMDFFDLDPSRIPRGPGLVAINPPYGLRLKNPEAGHGLSENILRQFMRHYSGWTFLLVLPDKNALQILSSKAIHRVLTVFHGGLNVFLVAGRI